MKKASADRLHLGQGARVAALAAGAAAAFTVGMRLSSPADSQESDGDVVAPVARVGISIQAKVASSGAPNGDPAAATVPEGQHIDRLSDQVAHNPFGTLNLNASAVPSAIDEALARAVLKKHKEPPKAAPPPPPPPPPSPPPAAPPLPFTAIGSIAGADVTGGKPVAFIKQQDQLLLVRAGDAVGQQYRVESITGQRIEFMYLPLMQRQALVLAP